MNQAGQVLFRLLGIFLSVVITLWVFGVPLQKGLGLLYEGAFASKYAWSQTFVKTTPLLITGVAIAIAWKAGAYNIGGEGQYIVGGLLAATVARPLIAGGQGGWWTVLILLVSAAVGGAVWAWLAGWLYIKRGVELVISTILLNFIGIQLLAYAVNGPLRRKEGGVPLTDILPDAMTLAKFDRKLDAHWGIPIAILVAVLAYIYLYRTRDGFKLRVVGENPRLARTNAIPPEVQRMKGIMLSGALCGLAGGIQYTALTGQLGESFAQNFGFVAIPVALLGSLNPLIILVSAFFFGALFASTSNFSAFTSSGPTLVYVIQAVSIFGLLGFQWFASRKKTVAPISDEAVTA